MATIGLLGDEYDSCIGILKMRIEDAGHTARIFNLRHFPRVTRASIDRERIRYDGHDLLEVDCFFLRELGVRDPFFHVRYSEELWSILSERYNAFAEAEKECIPFAVGLVKSLASQRAMVNPPHVYELRRMVPLQLRRLASKGIRVAEFEAGIEKDQAEGGLENALFIDLEEQTTYDVPSFPKALDRASVMRRKKTEEPIYSAFVLGEKVIGCTLCSWERAIRATRIETKDLPPELSETSCKAARAVEAVFARVDLESSGEKDTPRVLYIDPAPDFYEFEASCAIPISKELAGYLVEIASKALP